MVLNVRRPLTLLVVILYVCSVLCTYVAHAEYGVTSYEEVWGKFTELFRYVEELSSEGMNVSLIVSELNDVLTLIEENTTESLTKAMDRLRDIELEVSELRGELPSFKFWRDVTLVTKVAILASIPILTYLLLPRVYISLWLKYRRRWVVKK